MTTINNIKFDQETLEEAAEKYTDFWLQNKGLLIVDAFNAGAKWQQQHYGLSELSTMTIEDLKSLHIAIVNQIKYRTKSELYVGAICKVDHPKAYGKKFRIEKINPKNVICREVNGSATKWTISATMLKIVE